MKMAEWKRGIKCSDCHSFDIQVLSSRLSLCSHCGAVVGLEIQIADYFSLYTRIIPDEVYTRRDIKEHINIDLTEYALQKIIKSNFKKLDDKQRIYYFSP